LLGVVALIPSCSAGSSDLVANTAPRMLSQAAAQRGSDVYIEQARGRVGKVDEGHKKNDKEATDKSGTPAADKAASEGTAGAGQGQTNPVTCNPQNTPSAACYTATQQARPTAR
jgi:hypothetical protein